MRKSQIQTKHNYNDINNKNTINISMNQSDVNSVNNNSISVSYIQFDDKQQKLLQLISKQTLISFVVTALMVPFICVANVLYWQKYE